METITGWWQWTLDAIGTAHPIWLFLAMTFLPLAGIPASPLWILSGVRLGTNAGFALSVAALLVNLSAGYWLARGWLRSPLARWVERRGWQVPQLSAADETLVILLLRVTPGVPLFAQNYLLGLAEVHFVRYLLLSIPIQAAYALAFVWFGHSLTSLTAWRFVLAAGVLVGLGLFIGLLRRWLTRWTRVTPPLLTKAAKP